MTLEQFRKLYDATPFQPFLIHLADGRELPVLSKEFILVPPNGRIVAVSAPEGTIDIIDLILVTGLELKPGTSLRKKK